MEIIRGQERSEAFWQQIVCNLLRSLLGLAPCQETVLAQKGESH
jgi:hypothetical protein